MTGKDPIHGSSTITKMILHTVREQYLLSFFCLLSLSCAGYFLIAQKSVQASSNNRISLKAAVVSRQEKDHPPFPPSFTTAETVKKALAFKSLLTTDQQSALEQTYTSTLARRWSN